MYEFTQKLLHESEGKCTQDELPACAAACPLHLDGRGLCEKVAETDFTGGRKLVEAACVFPRLVARYCEAPCAQACLRKDFGGGIQMPGLEVACLTHGAPPKPPRFKTRLKKLAVAVLGDGIFSLAAAAELVKRGYPVTLYGSGAHPLEALADYAVVLDTEVDALLKGGLTFVPNQCGDAPFPLGEEGFKEAGFHAAIVPEGGDGMPKVQGSLGESLVKGIFVGGGTSSLIKKLGEARTCAITVDRYVQGVSLGEGREKEAPFETTLRVNTKSVKVETPIPLDEGAGESPGKKCVAEARRCLNCTCLQCVPGCAYLQFYDKEPKKLIREIFNNLSVAMGLRTANTMINSCALCGQCAVVCPNGLDVGALCHLARENMVEVDKMPARAHSFALQDMAYSNSENYFLVRHQPGWEKSDWAYFPGCMLGASAPELLEKSYGDLMGRLEGGIGLILGCCGVMLDWAGRPQEYQEALAKLQTAWEELGRPTVITACPTCYHTLGEKTPMAVRGIWEFLENHPPGIPGKGQSLVIHDACGARKMPLVHQAIRALVEGWGYHIEEKEMSQDKSSCCGFGGLSGFANPSLGEASAKLAAAQGDQPVLAYCINCRDRINLGGGQARHLLEYIYGDAQEATADFSQRRYNRRHINEKLRRTLWEEDVEEQTIPYRLIMDEGIRSAMQERMVLESDVYDVLDRYRETGDCVLDAQGIRSTSGRFENVTFWVRFTEEGDGAYRIHGVYTHRMKTALL